jgi:hypothetical protein
MVKSRRVSSFSEAIMSQEAARCVCPPDPTELACHVSVGAELAFPDAFQSYIDGAENHLDDT